MSLVNPTPAPGDGSAPGVYAPPEGVWDEMRDLDGATRPHWAMLMAELAALPSDELERRQALARRLIQDNGVTFNQREGEEAFERPWDLDLVPLPLSEAEWRAIETGLIERAELLERIVTDVYGPQEMIRSGAIPPALVLGNPQFLRPLHGLTPKGGHHLHLYAADLGRGPDGRWWVLSDRTQSPTGMGYALENRIILRQVLPEALRDLQVRRLAAFFRALRAGLYAATGEGRPNAVLLTPGPSDETYFEHAYLARYLGFALVEGDDLTVRDGRVFLKTIGGLKPVDLILRRVEADLCDPLALRADAAGGVPGLVEAVRAGNVVIANGLGAGLVESAAFMSFLPVLAERLNGRPLGLPNIATWWCGDPAARAEVTPKLDALYLHPTYDRRPILATGAGGRLGADMSAAERDRLARDMNLRGHAFVAQEIVRLSTAPVEIHGGLVPRAATLRVFLARGAQGWTAMPGGLVRFADSADARAIAMRAGVGSKDAWVLSETPVAAVSNLLPRGEALEIKRTGYDLPSRAADNLYWFGRYVERAEHFARVLRALSLRLDDDAAIAGTSVFQAAIRLLDLWSIDAALPAAAARKGDLRPFAELLSVLATDPEQPSGLPAMLRLAQAPAGAVRDRLSGDTWRAISRLGHLSDLPPPAGDLAVAPERIDAAIRTLAQLAGLQSENMTRGPNWVFMDLGRRLERALSTAAMLGALIVDTEEDGEDPILDLALDIADSGMTYRARYATLVQAAPVIDLLVTDDTNPRSVAFQLKTLRALLAELPRSTAAQARGQDREIIANAEARVRAARVVRLAHRGLGGVRVELRGFLGHLEDTLPELSAALAKTYFRHLARQRAGFAPRAARAGEGT